MAAVSQAQDLTEFAGLLYQLRDGVLSQTEEGQHYIDIYDEYSAEIAALLLANPALYDQGYATLQLFVPAIEAIIDGNGDSVTITSAQIAQAEAFLDALTAEAGPGLRDTIIQERYRLPLDMMAGMSVNEAWNFIREYAPAALVWQPPLALSDPFEAQIGQTIPVKFRIEDANGAFVRDDTVVIRIYDAGSSELVAQVGVTNNPNKGVKISNNQYHFNLQTAVFAPGAYYLLISANSLPADNAGEKTIILTD